MRGAWDLTEPREIVAKLESDLARMRAAPRDAQAAVDFFMTGYHLADWVERDESRRRALIDTTPVLLIAGAIANGSKHFLTSDPRWDRAVVGLETGMRGPPTPRDADRVPKNTDPATRAGSVDE
jgi:hypothetical protein